MTATATEIKRHVMTGTKSARDVVLCLADLDGTSWATNRYWATRSSKLTALLDKFNVDASSYGTYEVNGSIHKRSDDAPRIGLVVGKASDYTDELTRLRTAAGDAYARSGSDYLALFTTPAGDVVAVRADWLEWLGSDQPYAYGERYGATRYAMKAGATAGAVAVIADRETRHGGHYDEDRHNVPETWTNEGPVLLAVVMTVRTNV